MNALWKVGEDIACSYLEKEHHYKILYRNYSKPRWGEIDIIALDGEELVFVEVKTRSTNQYGDPLEAVSYHKISSLKRSINYFLLNEGKEYQSFPMKIEVIGIKVYPHTNKVHRLDKVMV